MANATVPFPLQLLSSSNQPPKILPALKIPRSFLFSSALGRILIPSVSLPVSLVLLLGQPTFSFHPPSSSSVEKDMFQYNLGRPSSCSESLQAIEADIHHANSLAAAIHKAYGGASIKMRLSCSSFGHVLLFLMQRMDCTCICSIPGYLGLFHVIVNKVSIFPSIKGYIRKGLIGFNYSGFNFNVKLNRFLLMEKGKWFHMKEGPLCGSSTVCESVELIIMFGSSVLLCDLKGHMFYAYSGIIYPTLEQLESEIVHSDDDDKGKGPLGEVVDKTITDEWWKVSNTDSGRDHECGICLEVGTKMVLPNCNHAMCINCYRDWNLKSQSCPFCRDSLKRIASSDLWVLMNEGDVVDTELILEENLKRFHVFIDKLPLAVPESVFVMYYEFLV